MIVLDVSAAIEIAKGTKSGRALRALVSAGEPIAVPDLFTHELANACWKHHHAGALSAHDARALYQNAMSIVDEVHGTFDCGMEVLNESMRLGHPAYDVFYLVLARRLGATLITLDERLNALADQVGVERIHAIEL